MSAFCGTITSSSQSTSNGNFSYKYDSGQQKYTVDYNGNVNAGAAVVVSPTQQIPVLTYMLPTYTNGFTLQVFQDARGELTPATSGSSFIEKDL
ncbi:hypothetical protein [Kordia sp.]|uniref:hypothetical protein n=1 Tax=Kordia sp. TaxID=1965332 RepID=UPI0025C4B96C|nr:hypothetical protein [Kordia sp.]MCH2196240.1 hypothetical protein [Kordia sp.]